MIWPFLVGALMVAAYYFGKRTAVEELKRSIIIPGTWVEVTKPITYKEWPKEKAKKIPVGTQAVVTGVDSQGRLSLYITGPWAKNCGQIPPKVFEINDFGRLAIKPDASIPKETRQQTVKDMMVWAEHDAKLMA